MAGWLARSLAVAWKGWKGQGRDRLQLPWSLCIPSLLSREGRPDPEFWSMRPEGQGLRGKARVVWRTEPVRAETQWRAERHRRAGKWQELGDRMGVGGQSLILGV